ncbi:BhlA/UviB family holin-like peptide [Tepidibacter formicigenes]|uniref:BhlA/UviB family holin-like peptide n=1 Tax=Tepidibacter formicigenes TaxID=227138 RepID=UPI002FE5286D
MEVKKLEEKIIELASSQGIWTALTVALIFYILKNQEKRDLRQEEREIKYQNIISKLTEKLNLVEDIKEDVQEIKNHVFKKEA